MSYRRCGGIQDLGVFEVSRAAELNIKIDRDKISRYGLNVSDVQDTIETAWVGRSHPRWWMAKDA